MTTIALLVTTVHEDFKIGGHFPIIKGLHAIYNVHAGLDMYSILWNV